MSLPPMPPGGGDPVWPTEVPGKPNRRPWIIIALSFAAVVALVVGLLVWQSGSGGDGSGPPSADGDSGRTVGLLRKKDPVCDEWVRYADKFADDVDPWEEVDKTIPASKWDDDQRRVFEAAAVTIKDVADRFESISSMAKHMALRELIAQTVFNWRKYAAAIPDYKPSDGSYAGIATNFGGAVLFMCTAVPILESIKNVQGRDSKAVGDYSDFKYALDRGDPACSGFLTLIDRQKTMISGWIRTDPAISNEEWTTEQRELNMAVKAVLAGDAEYARTVASEASDPVFADLIFTYGAYLDAYVEKLAVYTPDDNQIWRVSTLLGGGIAASCGAR